MPPKKKQPEIIVFYDEDDAEAYDRDPIKWRKIRKLEDLYNDDRISAEEFQRRYRIINEKKT